MVYLLIRKQVRELQLGRLDRMTNENNVRKGSGYRGQPLNAYHREECFGTVKCTGKMHEADTSIPSEYKNDAIPQSQNKMLVVADCNAPNQNKMLHEIKNLNDLKSTENRSHSVESATTYPVADIKINNDKLIASRKRTETQISNSQINQKSKRIRSKTAHEFRKATLLILFSLFFCYFPRFIQRFYVFATRDRNNAHFAISNICVLLNSSLNAAILIACSKEIRKHIRALVFGWLGIHKATA